VPLPTESNELISSTDGPKLKLLNSDPVRPPGKTKSSSDVAEGAYDDAVDIDEMEEFVDMEDCCEMSEDAGLEHVVDVAPLGTA